MSGISGASGISGVSYEGERLDVAAARISGKSRSYAAKLIESGGVTVDGMTCQKTGIKLKAGQTICVYIPDEPADGGVLPTDMSLHILYEDNDIAVIDKPAGLVTHPSAGHSTDTLVNGLLHQMQGLSGIGGALRPGIVHRLDKDTSGLLIVAKNDASHAALSAMFANHEIKKTYIAVVRGKFQNQSGTVDMPIGRHPTDRKKMAVISNGNNVNNKGRNAVTQYAVMEEFRSASVLSVNLITGRTHQIRVHMSKIGHPVLGDAIYGDGIKSAPRLMLHAAKLTFMHPITKTPISLESELPEEFASQIRALRGHIPE